MFASGLTQPAAIFRLGEGRSAGRLVLQNANDRLLIVLFFFIPCHLLKSGQTGRIPPFVRTEGRTRLTFNGVLSFLEGLELTSSSHTLPDVSIARSIPIHRSERDIACRFARDIERGPLQLAYDIALHAGRRFERLTASFTVLSVPPRHIRHEMLRARGSGDDGRDAPAAMNVLLNERAEIDRRAGIIDQVQALLDLVAVRLQLPGQGREQLGSSC